MTYFKIYFYRNLIKWLVAKLANCDNILIMINMHTVQVVIIDLRAYLHPEHHAW